MDKIIVEYQLKTEELRKELGDVKKQLSDTEKQVETSGSKMSNTFKNVGKAIAGAFAIREIVQFGQEV
jgi:ribosomal protein L29